MKRFLAVALSVSMILAIVSCSENTNGSVATTAITTNEEDTIDDEAWDKLKELGQIQTDNGVSIATITLPKDIVGEDVTQANIDAKAGENYISGKVNEDGSVTYKMTKKQHKAMLDVVIDGLEKSMNELLQNKALSFTSIKHNKDFTQFDVTVGSDHLGSADSLATVEFYFAGAIYGIFSGNKEQKVIVNYYDSSGKLINTADSSKLGESNETPGNVSESDFEVKEYLFAESDDTICYFVVKNNSSETVAIGINATALDKEGNTIGAGDASVDIVGPGEETICYAVFEDVKGVDHVSYTMKIRAESFYEPIISGLEIVKTVNKKNVVVSVTNKTNKEAGLVEVYALFFDKNGKLIGTAHDYLVMSGKMKPGEKLSVQLSSEKAFNRVEVYLTGWS